MLPRNLISLNTSRKCVFLNENKIKINSKYGSFCELACSAIDADDNFQCEARTKLEQGPLC